MKEDNLRIEGRNKLKYYFQNPGYFSILLLGDTGTGKEFILMNILKEKEISSEKFTISYPFQIGDTEEEISKIFEKNYIIIKNAEELSVVQQNILFKALSTKDGKIGLNKNRSLKRIIFISSFNVQQLRESKKYWSDKFWDRVAQLVIRLPSFKDFSANIKSDFKSVWEKMEFKEYKKLPVDVEFYDWLKNNCGTFAGNFRDLDKIAILWHQNRIIEYESLNQKYKVDIETRIFRKVRKDFENFTHFPTQKTDTSNTFEFEKGKSWEHIERTFKSEFKAWAKKEYGTIKNATKNLNMPLRKMDKW